MAFSQQDYICTINYVCFRLEIFSNIIAFKQGAKCALHIYVACTQWDSIWDWEDEVWVAILLLKCDLFSNVTFLYVTSANKQKAIDLLFKISTKLKVEDGFVSTEAPFRHQPINKFIFSSKYQQNKKGRIRFILMNGASTVLTSVNKQTEG